MTSKRNKGQRKNSIAWRRGLVAAVAILVAERKTNAFTVSPQIVPKELVPPMAKFRSNLPIIDAEIVNQSQVRNDHFNRAKNHEPDRKADTASGSQPRIPMNHQPKAGTSRTQTAGGYRRTIPEPVQFSTSSETFAGSSFENIVAPKPNKKSDNSNRPPIPTPILIEKTSLTSQIATATAAVAVTASALALAYILIPLLTPLMLMSWIWLRFFSRPAPLGIMRTQLEDDVVFDYRSKGRNFR